MTTRTVGSQIGKTDYEDGNRGFYGLVSLKEIVATHKEGAGIWTAEKLILQRMRTITKVAVADNYFISKYYVHILKGGDIKVYGVGSELKYVG